MPGAVFLVASGSHHLDTRPSRARLRPLVPRSARGLSGIWEGQERGEIGRTGSGQDGSTTPTQPVPRLTQREHPRGTGHPMGRTGRCVSADNAACFRVRQKIFDSTRRYRPPTRCDACPGDGTSPSAGGWACKYRSAYSIRVLLVIAMAASAGSSGGQPQHAEPRRGQRDGVAAPPSGAAGH